MHPFFQETTEAGNPCCGLNIFRASSNIDRFSQFFHCYNLQEISSNVMVLLKKTEILLAGASDSVLLSGGASPENSPGPGKVLKMFARS